MPYRVMLDGEHTGGEYPALAAATRDAIHAAKHYRCSRLVVQSLHCLDWNNVAAYEWHEGLERPVEYNPTYMRKM